MTGFCWNESDHRRKAARDFDRGRKDRDQYDRHTFDGCKEAYTKEYDRLAREEEYRQEERRREEEEERRREQARAEERRQEAWAEEDRRRQREEREQQSDDEDAPEEGQE